jgi:hypothetical protein
MFLSSFLFGLYLRFTSMVDLRASATYNLLVGFRSISQEELKGEDVEGNTLQSHMKTHFEFEGSRPHLQSCRAREELKTL